MKRYIAASILSTLILTACGGGGSSEESSATSKSGTFNYDGIYVHPTNFSLMMVDSKRSDTNIIINDFDEDTYGIILSESAKTINNTMITTGYYFVSLFDGSDINHLSDIEMKATFNNSSVTWKSPYSPANDESDAVVYTMQKADDSLTLAEIVGTHTNPTDGSTWTINADGSFIVNDSCTISGNITRINSYFSVTNVEATQCADPALNGTYNDGVLLTVPHDGQTYIVGTMLRNFSILGGFAPIN
ncbi:hypothetical protein L4174_018845 [Photobacterium sp. CCB-ST2H9]|uniref:hypothetical protein n=1 Tax=Photobacterium sp. CCB-ST2H9 TaxID=2912855 RepID=UPI002005031B|nr:hypothetical protein [Photobacterium sp. CCB-ST2H9]UTM60118.1 hypothetical protein L4174_018845 [Photobacterium sp. CCB-ST2H9]